jgi:hypothetical protein
MKVATKGSRRRHLQLGVIAEENLLMFRGEGESALVRLEQNRDRDFVSHARPMNEDDGLVSNSMPFDYHPT